MLPLKLKAGVSNMEHVDWDDLRILLAIAREGTMRAAALACDLSAATLSRRLTELERRLGEPLIDRVPSGCTVTPFGQQVLTWAEQIETLAHQIERAGDVTGSHGLEGTVRINAVEWMSYILMKLLGSFQERFPGLAIEVLTSQRPYNLARREADIAIWSECPDEGDLYVRRIGKVRFGLYASRDYYLRHKVAIKKREWNKLSFVGYDERRGDHPAARWLKTLPGAPEPSLRCSYVLGVFDGVLGGSGLGVLAQLAGDTTSDLVCVEPHIRELDQDVWMVLHPALRGSERIRAVSNLVADIFR
jgi:DNA-binding transcriptional LysR family regulator